MTPRPAKQAYRATLRRLAAMRGVQASFTDAGGVERIASDETLARILSAMGSDAGTEARAEASERAAIEEAARTRIEPVTVAWMGRAGHAAFAPGRGPRGRINWTLTLEAGTVIGGACKVDSLRPQRRPRPPGSAARVLLPLPRDIPMGVHRLTIAHAGARIESTVISAPVKTYRPPDDDARRWGVFCPVHSLRGGRRAGIGDFSDLRDLAQWASRRGASMIATLPMLACFLGERPGPCDPSPYAPVSRLFWNELFIDPERTPEFAHCTTARRLHASPARRRESDRLARASLVDYRAAAALKRPVLEALAEWFFAHAGERSPTYRAFLQEKPQAREYARFRSATEHLAAPWTEWPASARLSARDANPRATRYHLYAQYAAWLELLALGAEMKAAGCAMYLDLPVGASGLGFDVWRHREQFVACATGAPPDPYFTSGQNWGFPPMHPDVCRHDGYGYLRACLASHMRHADVLRLDHVMAFHRLYWIPEGMPASAGAYVRYRDQEMYALLSLESHRYRCRLVGENLGTVPKEVERAIARHGLSGLYIAQLEAAPKRTALRTLPARCVASLNTHDMPPFAAFWKGDDIDARITLGMLDPSLRKREHAARKKTKAALVRFLRTRGVLKGRASDAASVRDAFLLYLAQSPAELLLVNIEDLWLESKWQNMPGTSTEHPNWRRRLRKTMKMIADDRGAVQLLEVITDARLAKPFRSQSR